MPGGGADEIPDITKEVKLKVSKATKNIFTHSPFFLGGGGNRLNVT